MAKETKSQATKIPPKPVLLKSVKEQLTDIDEKVMITCLQDAAVALKPFPGELYHKLEALQLAYREHKEDETIQSLIERAINQFIKTEGIEMWNELLEQEFVEWRWTFIHFVTKELKIVQPYVQVVIQGGKRYWRLMNGDQESFRKENQKEFDFSREEKRSVRMPWELFKILKNGGKRSGNVAITEERFLRAFDPHHQHQAAAVYQNLKEKGVLNEKNRLSHSWRVCAGKQISLQAIEDSGTYGFTKKGSEILS